MMTSAGVILDAGAMLGLGGLGVLCAWVMRRYSTLSARNLYAPAAVGGASACDRRSGSMHGMRGDGRGAALRVHGLGCVVRPAPAPG